MTSRPSPIPTPASAPFVGFAAAAHAVVTQLNRQLPGMSLWLVTRVTDDQQLVVASAGEWAERAAAGTAYSWQASMCLRMVSGAPSLAPDIASEPAYLPAAVGPLAHVRAYLGVPLLTGDGELFGTLCALARAPQPDRWHDAMPLVSVMGRMLTTVLAGEQAARDRSVEAAHAYALTDRDPLSELRNRRGFDQAVWTQEGRGRRSPGGCGARTARGPSSRDEGRSMAMDPTVDVGLEADVIGLRTALARLGFPAQQDDVLAVLVQRRASSRLLWRVGVLPRTRRYSSLDEICDDVAGASRPGAPPPPGR